MKPYLLILTLSLCGCIQIVPPPVDILTVLIDRTDSNHCSLDAMQEQIIKRMALSHNAYAGAELTIRPISHYKINESNVISIPSTDMFSINELERIKEIGLFKSELIQQIREMATVKAPQDESEVFHAIFTSLHRPGPRTIICFSDLMQHNEFFDAYDSKQMQQLKDHPEELSAKIDSLYPLQKTKQPVELILLYCPSSKETDEAFFVISSWLKKYLNTKGIDVRIGMGE